MPNLTNERRSILAEIPPFEDQNQTGDQAGSAGQSHVKLWSNYENQKRILRADPISIPREGQPLTCTEKHGRIPHLASGGCLTGKEPTGRRPEISLVSFPFFSDGSVAPAGDYDCWFHRSNGFAVRHTKIFGKAINFPEIFHQTGPASTSTHFSKQ